MRWVNRWERSEKDLAEGQRLQTSGWPPVLEALGMVVWNVCRSVSAIVPGYSKMSRLIVHMVVPCASLDS